MPENAPTCQIHKEYKCANAVLPGDADGFCILHSQDKGKDPQAFKAALQARWQQEDQEFYDFREVWFPGSFNPEDFFGSREFTKPVDFFRASFTEVDFSRASFTERANFIGVSFTEEANFREARFTEYADFSEARFTECADFSWAAFTEGDFFRANFKDQAYFSVASFTEGADFRGATFTKGDFSGATFTKGADFSEATFTEGADFSCANIGGQVVFLGINPQKEAEPTPEFMGDFGELQFQEQGRLVFQDVGLAHCTFTGTDLRHPAFHHVTWGSLGGRQIIYDEARLRVDEKKNPWFREWFRSQVLPWLANYAPYEPPPETPWGDRYGEVERLYRYLKINFETEQDYKNAGDFHYGEMEMHRRASKWRWFPFYWNNLYRVLSGYGERPSWALGWLLVFLVCMGGLVWWVDLKITDTGQLAGFGDAFNYLLQKATFQRPNWAEPVSFGGQLVAGLSALIIPGQAALFLLALRNRLGRRR